MVVGCCRLVAVSVTVAGDVVAVIIDVGGGGVSGGGVVVAIVAVKWNC